MKKITPTVPAVRFKGFTDSWKQCKLGAMVNFSKGTGYSKSDLKESGTPIILYGRLYTKYETIISDVDTFADEKTNSVFSEGGEVIVPASGETAEDISVASVVDQPGVLLGGDLNIVKPPSNLDSTFLAISISNGKTHRDMTNMAQGKSVVHLHNSDLAKIDLAYPRYEEQCRISQYFKNIDHLINLHQRKLDQHKQLKKYFLQNMFPAKGEKVPRVRFKGFTGDWKPCKLNDIYQSIGNAFVGTVTPYYVDSGHFYLESNNIKDGQINRDTEVFINEDFYNKQKDKWLRTGDIVMVQSGHVGHTAVIPDELDKTAAHALIMFRNPKIKVDPYFLNYQFQTTKAKKEFDNITVGNTIKHILASSMKEFTVDIPLYNEQQRISHHLKEIDCLINLYKSKLNELQSLKEFMLQNMFI